MAKNTTNTSTTNKGTAPANRAAGSSFKAREPQSLERAIALCPTLKQMEAIARAFPLTAMTRDNAQEFAAFLRESTEEHVAKGGQDLNEALSEQALAIHLQRVVGAYVSSAIGAGTYYGSRLRYAQEMTSKLANDARDEDRDAVAGFEGKAERARQQAAEAAAQAFALLSAAEGAVSAYAHLTGDEWKAYQPRQDQTQSVSSKSAAEQMGAFAG